MTNIIAKTTIEAEQVKSLLGKQVPAYRVAYSDRTSWLMSCFSELAYVRFNPLFESPRQTKIIEQSWEKFSQQSKASKLLSLIDLLGYDHEEETKKLIVELKTLNAKLDETFDTNGTQAMLISTNNFIILAFRGTEATCYKDIKSDVNAITVECDSGGMIHLGFKEAYEQVEIDIQNKLNDPQYKDKSLFITGHSLGGALATIASKKLTHQGGIASCYTFGSPRVGNDIWISNIKAPLYRVVNAADFVTMMPPSAVTISSASWLLGFIPQVGQTIKKFLLTKFGGYIHGGNMRYLTNCKDADFKAVILLYSVSWVYRMKMLYKKYLSWNSPLTDHSITNYRKKLAIIATNRNQ